MKLDFQPRERFGGMDGIQARHDFPNGYGVSVVRGFGTYGSDQGLYELAVMYKGSICYNSPITEDVVGWLTLEQAQDLADQVAALPKVIDDLSSNSDSHNASGNNSVVSNNDPTANLEGVMDESFLQRFDQWVEDNKKGCTPDVLRGSYWTSKELAQFDDPDKNSPVCTQCGEQGRYTFDLQVNGKQQFCSDCLADLVDIALTTLKEI